MAGRLLDTNHLSAALRRDPVYRNRIEEAASRGMRFGTCWSVLSETEVGILQTHDPEETRRRLRKVMRHVRIWPVDQSVVRLFGQVAIETRSAGRQLSFVDLTLAALCRHLKLKLLTSDRDFEALPDIDTENWLADPPP